jgi:hypothetical protein
MSTPPLRPTFLMARGWIYGIVHGTIARVSIIARIVSFNASPLSRALASFLHWLEPVELWTPHDGAWTGLFLGMATERLHADTSIRGQYYHPQFQPVHNRWADNETLQDQLWDFSNELVKEFLPSEGQAHAHDEE